MAHAFIVAGCLLLAADVDQLSVLPEQVNNVPRQEMVYEHLRGLAEKALQRRLKVVNNLKTAEQVRAYQQSRKQFFLEKIGTFPKRTPLNAKVTGKVERDDYVVERVGRSGFAAGVVSGSARWQVFVLNTRWSGGWYC